MRRYGRRDGGLRCKLGGGPRCKLLLGYGRSCCPRVVLLSIWVCGRWDCRSRVCRVRLAVSCKSSKQSSVFWLLVDFKILLSLRVPPSTTFRFERRIKGSDRGVFLYQDPISAVWREWVAGMRDVHEVCMLFAEEILEKGIHMHRSHPSFQSDCVLLHFLDRLAFRYIRRFDPKILSKLAPSFDLFGVKFHDKFPQGIDLKLFVVTPGRCIELRT